MPITKPTVNEAAPLLQLVTVLLPCDYESQQLYCVTAVICQLRRSLPCRPKLRLQGVYSQFI